MRIYRAIVRYPAIANYQVKKAFACPENKNARSRGRSYFEEKTLALARVFRPFRAETRANASVCIADHAALRRLVVAVVLALFEVLVGFFAGLVPSFSASSARASSSVIDSMLSLSRMVALTVPCFTYGP